MNCRECEDLLPAYVSGDLGDERVTLCRTHIGKCAACRESMELYTCLIISINESPVITPTDEESLNLSKSLRAVRPPSPAQPRMTWRQSLERIALAGMCCVSFVIVALITWSVRNGQVSINTLTDPVILLPSIVIIIFIVSFLPIIITARRKPLNGMTFRK